MLTQHEVMLLTRCTIPSRRLQTISELGVPADSQMWRTDAKNSERPVNANTQQHGLPLCHSMDHSAMTLRVETHTVASDLTFIINPMQDVGAATRRRCRRGCAIRLRDRFGCSFRQAVHSWHHHARIIANTAMEHCLLVEDMVDTRLATVRCCTEQRDLPSLTRTHTR